MNIKDVLVAVNEESIALVKGVDKEEYNKLLNEYEKKELYRQEEKRLEKEYLDKQIKRIDNHDLLLIKTIYDNFVDRGFIEDDEEMQRKYFEFIFNNAEFTYDDLNEQAKVIYERIKGLVK